uniref:Uncharacterized protein n=1 Tax=Glossina pallidipes TaxID=7398 RepID=A0A1B0AI48_GLOPL
MTATITAIVRSILIVIIIIIICIRALFGQRHCRRRRRRRRHHHHHHYAYGLGALVNRSRSQIIESFSYLPADPDFDMQFVCINNVVTWVKPSNAFAGNSSNLLKPNAVNYRPRPEGTS